MAVLMQRMLLIPSTSMVRVSYPVNWRRFDMRIHFAFGPISFGPSRTEGRASLSDFVVEALRQKKPITLFQDILFSPLHMDTLARYVRRSIEEELRGVFNLGCREGMSKADFALSIARHKGLPTTSATMGESHHLLGRARRPADMRMDVSLIEEAIGETMPTLECEIGKL